MANQMSPQQAKANARRIIRFGGMLDRLTFHEVEDTITCLLALAEGKDVAIITAEQQPKPKVRIIVIGMKTVKLTYGSPSGKVEVNGQEVGTFSVSGGGIHVFNGESFGTATRLAKKVANLGNF